MEILLINPPSIGAYYRVGLKVPPLGLAYIAAVLREKRHRVKIIDLAVEDTDYTNYPYHDFDLVGISADTLRYPVALRIAEVVKKRGSKVVLGGPHVTFFDREALETGLVDWVVRNEGEYPMLALAEHLERGEALDEVKGISYLSNGDVVATPPAPFVDDLDSLPFPARDLLPLDRYTHKLSKRYTATMLTSRGCPFNCDFCSSSEFSGIRWRARSVESMLEELRLLYQEYGYRAVLFFDDNFLLDPGRVEALSLSILERGWDLAWVALSRVDIIVKHERLVELMARSGLRMVFIGFESATQEVLDEYGKKIEVEESFKAMDILRRNKVKVLGSFMIGALNENKEMIKRTINFAKKLNPHHVHFSVLTPYPGTRLYEEVKDRLLTTNWEHYTGLSPVIKLDNLSTDELKRLLKKTYSSFYLRPSRLFTQGLPWLYQLLWGYKKRERVPLARGFRSQ
ncbi:B12-binding domain-containing radical SAM protein [Chloroflexota bacterium]